MPDTEECILWAYQQRFVKKKEKKKTPVPTTLLSKFNGEKEETGKGNYLSQTAHSKQQNFHAFDLRNKMADPAAIVPQGQGNAAGAPSFLESFAKVLLIFGGMQVLTKHFGPSASSTNSTRTIQKITPYDAEQINIARREQQLNTEPSALHKAMGLNDFKPGGNYVAPMFPTHVSSFHFIVISSDTRMIIILPLVLHSLLKPSTIPSFLPFVLSFSLSYLLPYLLTYLLTPFLFILILQDADGNPLGSTHPCIFPTTTIFDLRVFLTEHEQFSYQRDQKQLVRYPLTTLY